MIDPSCPQLPFVLLAQHAETANPQVMLGLDRLADMAVPDTVTRAVQVPWLPWRSVTVSMTLLDPRLLQVNALGLDAILAMPLSPAPAISRLDT